MDKCTGLIAMDCITAWAASYGLFEITAWIDNLYNDVTMSVMVSSLFTQLLVQAQIKDNIKVLRHCLCAVTGTG